MALDVLIVGGGPAAIEAALGLHRLAGDRVKTRVLAPEDEFAYRPLSVLAPFAAGRSVSYPMARIAADAGFEHICGSVARVDSAGHAVETAGGDRLDYEVLLLAVGAVPRPPFKPALTFGGPASEEQMHGLVQDVEGGYARSIAFVVPPGNTWPLPLYEVALMLADRAWEMGQSPALHLVTPEDSPLALFGPGPSESVAKLLDVAGMKLVRGVHAELVGAGRLRLAPGDERLAVDRIVTLPVLSGPRLEGVPADADGFISTDRHGRVHGVADVFAAGDATAFPIKQGGLACQQADAATEAIAARAGAELEPAPFTPVLRGVLLTETRARFMRRDASGAAGDNAAVSGQALWWPPTKIAGRELGGYLEGLDEEAGARAGGLPVAVHVAGDAEAGSERTMEVLSLLGARE